MSHLSLWFDKPRQLKFTSWFCLASLLACGGGGGGDGDNSGESGTNNPAAPGTEPGTTPTTTPSTELTGALKLKTPNMGNIADSSQANGLQSYSLAPVPLKVVEPQETVASNLANSGALNLNAASSVLALASSGEFFTLNEPYDCSDPSSWSSNLPQMVWCELWDNAASTRITFFRDILPETDDRIERVKGQALEKRRHCLVRAPTTVDYNFWYQNGADRQNLFATPTTMGCIGQYGSGSGWYAAGQNETTASYIDGSGQSVTVIDSALDGSSLELRTLDGDSSTGEIDSLRHMISYLGENDEQMIEVAFVQKSRTCGSRLVSDGTYTFLQGYTGNTAANPQEDSIGCTTFASSAGSGVLYREACVSNADFSAVDASNCATLSDPTNMRTDFITWMLNSATSGTVDAGDTSRVKTPADLVTDGAISADYIVLTEAQADEVYANGRDETVFDSLLNFTKIDPAAIIGDFFFKDPETNSDSLDKRLAEIQEAIDGLVPRSTENAAACFFEPPQDKVYNVPPFTGDASTQASTTLRLQCLSPGDKAFGVDGDSWYLHQIASDRRWLISANSDEVTARRISSVDGNNRYLQVLASAATGIFELGYSGYGQDLQCGGQIKGDADHIYVRGVFPNGLSDACPDLSTAEPEEFCLIGATLEPAANTEPCEEAGLTSFTLPPVNDSETTANWESFATPLPTGITDVSVAFDPAAADLLTPPTLSATVEKVTNLPTSNDSKALNRDPNNQAGINFGHNCRFDRTDQTESVTSFFEIGLNSLSATELAALVTAQSNGAGWLTFEVKRGVVTYFNGSGSTQVDFTVKLLEGGQTLVEQQVTNAEAGNYVAQLFSNTVPAATQVVRIDFTAQGTVFCDPAATGQPQAAVNASISRPRLQF